MCGTNEIFEETTACANDEWCTGPATKESAVSISIIDTLCETGKDEPFKS